MTKITHYELSKELLDQVSETFNFNERSVDEAIEISNRLQQTRHTLGSPILTGNQVGLPFNVVAVSGIDSCLFNVKITYSSSEESLMEESSLSYLMPPLKIKRASEVRIRYVDAWGKFQTAMYIGVTARQIQIAVDQINGIPYYNKASKLKLDRAKKKISKKVKEIS